MLLNFTHLTTPPAGTIPSLATFEPFNNIEFIPINTLSPIVTFDVKDSGGSSINGNTTVPYGTAPTFEWALTNMPNATCSANGGIDYYVLENEYGELSGYAWSDNIGWIQFGGLSNFPSGGGTYGQDAQVVNGELRGWAKALSGDGNGWDG